MNNYFPTPWHVDPYSGTIYAANVPKGSPRVADLRGWGYLTGKGAGALGLPEAEAIKAQQANAALIVKAVNSHDDLVRALQSIAGIADNLQGRVAKEALLSLVGRQR